MAEKIVCSNCGGTIESRDDLVVISFITLHAYHNQCYAQEMKGFNSLFFSRFPINSAASTLGLVLLSLILGILMLVEFHFILLILLLIGVGYRLASWYFYERLLD